METFETKDINENTCQFQYNIEMGDPLLNPEEITFKVYSVPSDEFRWFTYRMIIIDNLFCKCEMMDNNSNIEYSKKGIPERIIEIASDNLKRSIISSPKEYNPGNYLTPTSAKAWQRLVSQNNQAKYDKVKGCFIFEWKTNLGDS